MLTTAKNLETARARIENPENWCKEYFALDADHIEVDSSSSEAVAYCMLGALGSSGFGAQETALIRAIISLYPDQRFPDLPSFNDDVGTKHCDVMAVYDRAIANERNLD